MTRIIAIVALLIAAVSVSACSHTARGVGRDVQNDGQAAKKAVRGY